MQQWQRPGHPWIIRLATLADLPRIVDIYNATIPSRLVTADLDPVSVESRLPWFEAHQHPCRPLWVVETEDQGVAGWLSVSNFYGRPAYDKTAEISLYIDEAMRGCGLGSFLLGTAIAQAPHLNLDRLLAFVFGHNQPSLSLFAKFGFQHWGMLPGVALLEGIERDLIILGKQV
ncbi:MAG: N-acetyltransferase family protein [Thermosynechococcaceae cyanobacterium]